MDLAGKKVLVVGLGASGRAAAMLCLNHGAQVMATDQADYTPGAEDLARAGVDLHLGGHRPEDFTAAEVVVLSPGVDPRLAEVQAARQAGAMVLGEFELGWRFLEAPAVMITGSNGKSTVVTLVGEMLQAAGHEVFVGGNLGTPICDLVNSGRQVDWAVLEVSSFQLDTAGSLKPRVAAVLNITPDHLDRYDSFEDYAASKMSLTAGQDQDCVSVLCFDDAQTKQRSSQAGGRLWPYGVSGEARPGGGLAGGDLVLCSEDQELRISTPKSPLGGGVWRLNLLAASLCALACGAPATAIQQAVDNFAGLAHRMELVAELHGVQYIDDSKATNVGAVQAALAAVDGPVLLLLGGRDKQGGFAELAPSLGGRVRLVVCFGEAGPEIAAQLNGTSGLERVDDLESALRLARWGAVPGDAVLLSPGCASFDAYEGYAQRGKHFAALVKGEPWQS